MEGSGHNRAAGAAGELAFHFGDDFTVLLDFAVAADFLQPRLEAGAVPDVFRDINLFKGVGDGLGVGSGLGDCGSATDVVGETRGIGTGTGTGRGLGVAFGTRFGVDFDLA